VKRSRVLALALFGVGDFVLQVGTSVAGMADPGRGGLHLFRIAVLAPLSLVPSRILTWLPKIPHEDAPNTGLYTFLGVLLLNTLIWTMFFNLCLTAVQKVGHSRN
jgi:hypothetical protein